MGGYRLHAGSGSFELGGDGGHVAAITGFGIKDTAQLCVSFCLADTQPAPDVQHSLGLGVRHVDGAIVTGVKQKVLVQCVELAVVFAGFFGFFRGFLPQTKQCPRL